MSEKSSAVGASRGPSCLDLHCKSSFPRLRYRDRYSHCTGHVLTAHRITPSALASGT